MPDKCNILKLFFQFLDKPQSWITIGLFFPISGQTLVLNHYCHIFIFLDKPRAYTGRTYFRIYFTPPMYQISDLCRSDQYCHHKSDNCIIRGCFQHPPKNFVLVWMGWRIPSLSKSHLLSHQLSHLTTVPHINLAMAAKPPQLIKASFTLYKYYDNIFSCILVINK